MSDDTGLAFARVFSVPRALGWSPGTGTRLKWSLRILGRSEDIAQLIECSHKAWTASPGTHKTSVTGFHPGSAGRRITSVLDSTSYPPTPQNKNNSNNKNRCADAKL